MKHYLTVEAVIRGTWCEVVARLDRDAEGPFSVIEVTEAESGLPLFEDDDIVAWHLSQIDLHAIAQDYARHGHLRRAAPEPMLAEVIPLPIRDAGVAA